MLLLLYTMFRNGWSCTLSTPTHNKDILATIYTKVSYKIIKRCYHILMIIIKHKFTDQNPCWNMSKTEESTTAFRLIPNSTFWSFTKVRNVKWYYCTVTFRSATKVLGIKNQKRERYSTCVDLLFHWLIINNRTCDTDENVQLQRNLKGIQARITHFRYLE